MAEKNLVIVESPAKAKTIGKYLGRSYTVKASMGHLRDLPKSKLGIDIEHDFEPDYKPIRGKEALIRELKEAAKESDTVYLATDPDREGEAISWHLKYLLDLNDQKARRVTFNEITKNVVQESIARPREIDQNLVDAQQARRVLDRIVGFELSPVLWKKIKPALSAGRVQSVVVRLIMEREHEIKNFRPEQFYRVNARFATADGTAVGAELSKRLADDAQARELLAECSGTSFKVSSVNVRPVKKSPAPPFTTSTLQQEAARKLGFTVSQTMMVAQRLYEAGHITYMRTDSLNLSQLALNALAKEIRGNLGEQYLHTRQYHTHSKGAQEAHEAIRPTYVDKQTIEGTAQEKRLYSLIWKRTLASQMADAEIEKTTVEILPASRQEHFTATGEVVRFDGFLKVYLESTDDETDEQTAGILPAMHEGETLSLTEMTATQRFTQQPPRYSEGSLVKKLEELGIGRPSTYATFISTILQREYVERGEKEGTPREYEILTVHPDGKISRSTRTETVGSERGKLVPTDIGEVVNEYLTENFPDILDYNFTAQTEERFDDIARGKLGWHQEIQTFYDDFHPGVDRALNTRTEHRVGERILGTDPATGRPVSVKIGRFGPMIQLGDGEGDEKPQFASLLKGQSVSTITLEEALKLFEFPRLIGSFEDQDVTVAIGRFGPYVKHAGKFVSIPKELSPAHITLDEAVELIEKKRAADANKTLKTFDEDADMQILNGRYGPYIKYKGGNFKIPKTVAEPAALTLDECRKIVAEAEAKPASPRTRGRRKS